MQVNTKTRCPMCKRFVSERNNAFSHHMGINLPGNYYGISRKQLCFASGYPINNPQAIIDYYNHVYNCLKETLAERKKAKIEQTYEINNIEKQNS